MIKYTLMNKSNFLEILDSLRNTNIKDCEYDKTDIYTSLSDKISSILNLSLYILDLKKYNFLYISDNKLFLSGFSKEYALKKGFSFFNEITNNSNISKAKHIIEESMIFYYNTPKDRRYDYSLEFDTDLINISRLNAKRVNIKMSPLVINRDGYIWLVLGIVSPAVSKAQKDNAIIYNIKAKELYSLSDTGKGWDKSNICELNNKEQKVLQLTEQGLTNDEIAQTMKLNINTIKYHKRNIYQKLNVNNCVEAVAIATHWGLL